MELMLDSADLGELKRGLADWPVSGVTTNPTILRRAGESDVWAQLQKIRALAGDLCSLHEKDPRNRPRLRYGVRPCRLRRQQDQGRHLLCRDE